jgi:hypothetical protein
MKGLMNYHSGVKNIRKPHLATLRRICGKNLLDGRMEVFPQPKKGQMSLGVMLNISTHAVSLLPAFLSGLLSMFLFLPDVQIFALLDACESLLT